MALDRKVQLLSLSQIIISWAVSFEISCWFTSVVVFGEYYLYFSGCLKSMICGVKEKPRGVSRFSRVHCHCCIKDCKSLHGTPSYKCWDLLFKTKVLKTALSPATKMFKSYFVLWQCQDLTTRAGGLCNRCLNCTETVQSCAVQPLQMIYPLNISLSLFPAATICVGGFYTTYISVRYGAAEALPSLAWLSLPRWRVIRWSKNFLRGLFLPRGITGELLE